MILFLDFDGVLHPFPMTPASSTFSATSSLWALLEKPPEIYVVITSTWREQFQLPQLVNLLGEHGGANFAARFIGMTPIMESATDYIPGIRQREIESWLTENGMENERYIILDDIEDYFDSTCAHLYLVDGVTGLTEYDVQMISEWINASK